MRNLLLAAAAAFVLSGCAAKYVGKPFMPTAEPITKVAIAQDAMPAKLSANEAASVGSNFGLIGALVDAGVQSSRQNAMNDALATVSFDAEKIMQDALTASLASKNIEVKTLEGPDRGKREFLLKYPDATDGTQAYLDLVVLNYGYAAAGNNENWRPIVDASVRMVDASTKKVLLENRISYNVMYAPQGVVTISANPEYAFFSRDHMTSSPDRLAEGLKDAFKQVADTAVRLMQ